MTRKNHLRTVIEHNLDLLLEGYLVEITEKMRAHAVFQAVRLKTLPSARLPRSRGTSLRPSREVDRGSVAK